MTTIASYAVVEAFNLIKSANLIAAMSLTALRGSISPFDRRIHEVRNQHGQQKVAEEIRLLFDDDDEVLHSHKDCDRVQDPYSFRCIPAVHGASWDTFEHSEKIVHRELNAVTDNPLVFENGDVLSGGNFHGQPVSVAMDFLSIAASEIGSIAERRIDKLMNPHLSGGQPPFLAHEGGVQSGFMIPHVVAASLASENKVLSHPASTDSIPTSADQEDHVSMGPHAARKARQIIRNVEYILAIELLVACQGLDFLKPLKPSKRLKKIHDYVRGHIPESNQDRSTHPEIEWAAKVIKNGDLIREMENCV